MKSIKLLALTCLMFGLRAEEDVTQKEVGLLITSPELVQDILSKYSGTFTVDDSLYTEDGELITRGCGSTNPVTSVFYNGQPITNTSLSTTNATAGAILRQSGRYYIANNLRRKIAANAAYIEICGNNTILDMNGTTIQGGLQTTSTSAVGIRIPAGKQNVTVINGAITDIQGEGIQVGGGSKTINLENLDVACYKTNGIRFIGSGTQKITLKNVDVTTSKDPNGTAIGLDITGVTTGSIENSSFNNNSGAVNFGSTGVHIDGCHDLAFRNTEANANVGLSDSDTYGFAMFGDTCSGLKFENCTANNNRSTGFSDVAGFVLATTVTDSIFTNCEASSNSCDATTNDVDVAGFGFGGGSTGNQFVNCSAIGNTSSTTNPSSVTAGFYLSGSNDNNNTFKNCTAESNNITGLLGASTCGGFISANNNSCRFSHCNASGNFHKSVECNLYGILLRGGTSNSIDTCVTNGQYCDTTSGAGPALFAGTIAGISLEGGETQSSVDGCTVTGNAYRGTRTGPDIAIGQVFGIQLGTGHVNPGTPLPTVGATTTTVTGADRCSVLRNTVRSTGVTDYGSSGDEHVTLAGFIDWSIDSNSLIAGNILALNGYNRLEIGSAPDYTIEPGGLLASSAGGGLNFYIQYDNGQNPADMIIETDVSNLQALSTGLDQWSNFLVVPQQS